MAIHHKFPRRQSFLYVVPEGTKQFEQMQETDVITFTGNGEDFQAKKLGPFIYEAEELFLGRPLGLCKLAYNFLPFQMIKHLEEKFKIKLKASTRVFFYVMERV